jgi:hypothetical protein
MAAGMRWTAVSLFTSRPSGVSVHGLAADGNGGGFRGDVFFRDEVNRRKPPPSPSCPMSGYLNLT